MDRSRHGAAFHTVVTVHQVFQEAARVGVGPAELAALTGLDPAELIDFSRRIPAERLFSVWETVMRRVRDPGFPVRAAQNSVRDARSPVFFLVNVCANIREAVEATLANVSAWTTAYTISAVPWEDTLSLVIDGLDPSRLGARCEAEFQLADILASARRTLGEDFTPLRAAFAHAEPADISAHRAYFGTGLRFGAPHTEIVVHATILDTPLDTAQPGLAGVLSDHVAGLRAAHDPPASYRLQVRAWLLRQFLAGSRPTIAAAARALTVSERTLHRRLTEEGVTFRETCEETRRQLALDLVRTSPRAFKEIATTVGFADQRSFHRAYLRWTGTTPLSDRLART